MTNKPYISLIGVLLTGLVWVNLAMAAAPPNDVLYDGSCNAITLPLDGTCVTGESNEEANPDYYGGCINSNNPTVFYTFTLSSASFNAVDITFTNTSGGTEVELFLFGGTCDAPSGITATCEPLTTTFSFYDLDFGTTYYLMVSSNPGGNLIDFDICSQEYFGSGTRTGPEQDCDGAIPICSDSYTETISYTGFWNTQEIPSGSTCLFGGENNSVWYVITPQVAGDLYFTINTAKDYDFALYDITTIGCAGIPSATPIRCNYSATAGPTGLTLPYGADPKTPAISVGAMGSPTMEGVNVVVGDVFVLIVDNWTGDNNGFILDFTASTMTLFDGDPPTFVSATASCTANTITVTMSELIDCFTIVQGDFVLTNTTTSTDYTSDITMVTGSNCGSYTDEIVFTYNAGALPSGVYEFSLITNPVLVDKCGNVIANTQTVSFNYLAAIAVVPSVTTVCSGGTVDLNVSGAPPSTANIYTLNPGGTLASSDGSGNATYSGLTPTVSTVYTVSVTYGGCTNTAQTVITVQDNIVVSISPVDPTVCSGGDIDLVATTTINGTPCASCDYQWSGGSAQNDLGVASSTVSNAGVGTYNVDVTTAVGCASNTATSVVSTAGGGPATSCDVWYVTPAGGGDGLTKTTPIDLATALTNAECTNAIIKMAVGNYPITDYVLIKSFVTLEGGYINTFADKSSDLTSGNATVIRRSDAADSDQALRCTAFRVQSSSTDFRFQDIRIELPGTHAAGSGISNYGIYLESGCSGYKIVRCYIDAGTGAN